MTGFGSAVRMRLSVPPRSLVTSTAQAIKARLVAFLRTLFLRHRALALLLVAATLCLKAVVPTGYMIGHQSKTLTVLICGDGMDRAAAQQLAIPLPGEPGDGAAKQGKGDCPYGALSMASLAGADPAQLALALTFILALGFAAASPNLFRRIDHLRPPLRGPPALA